MTIIRNVSGMCAALAFVVGGMSAAHAESKVQRKVAADPRGEVVISNVAGSVSVSAWNRNEVDVQGEISENVERVDVLKDGPRTIVKVILPNNSSSKSSADLTIRVPTGASLDISTVSAEIDAGGVTGAMRLKSVSGDIRAESPQGEAEFKTVSGDVNVRGSGKTMNARGSTVSGDFVLTNGAGDFEIVTVSGDLVLEMSPARNLRLRTTSGDARVTGRLAPDARVDAETVSGDVNVAAAAPSGLSVEVDTFSGELDSCFGEAGERVAEFSPGQRMSFKRGGGGARVRVKTLSGDVQLCDR